MSLVINLQIIAHSTDEIAEYLGPKADVDKLVNYLKVEGELPAGLTMVQVSSDTPTTNLDVPWFEIDGSNNPVALKYHNGSSWVEAKEPLAVQSFTRNMYQQGGQVSFEYWNTSADQWKESIDLHEEDGQPSEFLFPYTFKTPPHIQITPVKSALFQDEDFNVEWVLGNVSITGFTIWVKYTGSAITEANRLFVTFDYLAIGEMEE